MARRVFFSFDYHKDFQRANQIYDLNVVGGADLAGFFNPSDVEEASQKGKEAIQRLILKHLDNTCVTVVLIGSETADDLWVKYEIEQSIARQNGLLGIDVHHLKDRSGQSSPRGRKPSVPGWVQFPIYDWDGNLAGYFFPSLVITV